MKRLLSELKTPLFAAAVISIGVNLLMLVSPIFMMQVFDRVLMSGHLETLYGLLVIAIVALVVLGLLDALRQLVLARAGDWLERAAGHRLIEAVLGRGLAFTQAFQHVGSVRRFFCAQGVFALLDAPWVVIFAALLWWMHPWLGMIAVAGAVVLMMLTLLTELSSRRPLSEAGRHQVETQAILSSALRNGDAVRSMGMADRLSDRWQAASEAALDQQKNAAERGAMLAGAAKATRLIIQTLTLGIGALLVLDGALSPGGMIAASILLGRCLAPVEQAIGAWKGFVQAREAWTVLAKLPEFSAADQPMDLPPPTGKIEIDQVTFQPDPARPPILDQVSLTLSPGSVLCLVGPTGSGKTTLSRLIVGALSPSSGEVRLDGRRVTGWNPAQLGAHLGYLPQGVDLLPGSLKENIQRFGPDNPKAVVQAAQAAGIDDMIRGLADGYETEIRAEKAPVLSAGQLQRIGLARALYGAPKVIILDEPNANLDVDGEKALSAAVRAMADHGSTVLVISHRPALLEAADRIAVLQGGKLINEGTKAQMLRPRPVNARPMQAKRKPVAASRPAAPHPGVALKATTADPLFQNASRSRLAGAMTQSEQTSA